MNDMAYKKQHGIALVMTLLIMSVLLGVSASLAHITLKQLQLTSVAYSSEIAFQAANAGMECVFYHDFSPAIAAFDVPGDGTRQSSATSIGCMGAGSVVSMSGPAASGEEQRFQFTWGGSGQTMCSDVSVYKFYSTSAPVPVVIDGVTYRADDCPAGSVCTVVQSRGYNTSCASVSSALRVVEREYTQVY